MTLFTTTFWADAAERAIKSFAQAILVVQTAGSSAIDLLHVDWKQTLLLALGSSLASLLTSIVSAQVTSSDSASLAVNTVPKG